MTLAARLQQAISAPHEDADEIFAAANQTMARCTAWLEQGLVFEAAALNADAGNVVGLLIRLSGGTVPDGLAMPSRRVMDRLARLPVIAAEHRKEFAVWITANLTDAPLLERLSAISRLHAVDPTNPAWKASHEQLERVAVTLWNEEVDRCITEGDALSLAAAGRQADAMMLLTPAGQRLLHKIDRAQTAAAKRAASSGLTDLADRLHLAWAAMDFDAARRLLGAWKSLDQRSNCGNQADVRAVAAWIRTETDSRRHDAHIEDLIADVVRALDELEPLGVVEQRYATLLKAATHIPPAVEARVTHRIAEGRRQRARRYVVSVLTIVAVAALVTTAVIVRQRSLERSRTIEHLAACMESNLHEGRLRVAVDCWEEARRWGLIDEPQISARRAGIDRAVLELEEAEQRFLQDVRDMHAAAGSATLTLEQANAHFQRLTEMESDLPSSAQTAFAAALKEVEARRGELIEALRDDIKQSLSSIEQRVPDDLVAAADLPGWRTRRATLAAALDALNAVDLKDGLAGTDLQLRASRLDARIRGLHGVAHDRIEQLEEVETVAAELRRIPISEATWAAAWSRLLELNPAFVHNIDPNAWTEASEASLASQATAHWRDHVLPIVAQAGLLTLDSPISAAAAGRADTTLRAHLDLHDQYTPYHKVAAYLGELAAAVQNQSSRGDLRQAMSDAGLLELHRAPHAGGYRYMRSETNSWLRIDSNLDLALKPSMLKPISAEDFNHLYASPAVPPILTALLNGLDAWEKHDAQSDAAVLDLVTAVEAVREPDELLRLATIRAVWQTLLDQQVPMSQTLRATAGDWLDSIGRDAPAAAQADWPRLAQSADGPAQLATRRQAREAVNNAPSAAVIERLHMASLDSTATRALARAIAGVLTPDLTGQLKVDLVGTTLAHGEVLAHDGRRWRWVPLPPLHDGGTLSPPKGVPLAPTIIFSTP